MFTIVEEHYNEDTVKNSTRQVSSIKFDSLMNPIHSTFYNAGMTGDMAFFSSEFLGMRLCQSGERLKHFAYQIAPQ
jgi:hypothetical protein